jgi:pimeloyl-ACP methyl ester carboxylesterase
MHRRDVLKAGAGTAVAALAHQSASADQTTKASATFVLVHGTWLGGWIWADVAERLRANGHRVFTPTLTGVGERHHLISPQIGLDTHIADIVGVLDYEELSDVILIGHSFSGVAVTGAADQRRSKIRHIGFFDALIPHEGRMTGVEMKADGSETDDFMARRAGFIDGYQMVFLEHYPMKMLIGDEHPELQAKVKRLLTPHPAKAWTDRLVLKNGGWEGLPRTCWRGAGQSFAPSSAKMWGPATDPGWNLIDVPVGRMGMMTDPAIVANAFGKLAA